MTPGSIGRIKNGGPLDMAVVKVIRQSKRTAGLTVEMMATVGAYAQGAQVNIAPYELEVTIPAKAKRPARRAGQS